MSNDISKLLQYEHNLRECDNEKELYYSIVNQTRELVDYEQAILFTVDLSRKPKVIGISDIVTVDNTSPFVQFMQDLLKDILSKYSDDELRLIDINNDLEEGLKTQLREYSPSNLVYIPLKIIKNSIEIEYFLILTKNKIYEDKELEILKYISSSIKYSLFAMSRDSLLTKLKNYNFKSSYFLYGLAIIVLAMFIPVKMNVIAPCTIEPKNPFIVTSPIEGVVKDIKVNSNDYVKDNKYLVKLEDIDLKNSYEVAQRRLDTIKAELYSAKQASFYDVDKKSQIKRLEEEVKLNEAEVEYAKSLLDKTDIYSKKEGIVIIDNPNEWKGKPVVTGEKILSIANPKNVEIDIMLSVHDALFLKEDADVSIFLDNRVFESWKAKVTNISYKPELTPENSVVYKINAEFIDLSQNNEIPKIGLRGTAKIYSEKVTLFFYLFRKPITSLRQMLAW